MLPLAVQLWSVRDEVAKDVPATLAALAKIGYDGIETAGLANASAAVWTKALADNGLRVAGAHVGIDTLLGDNFNKTTDEYLAIGCKRITVPYLGGEYQASLDGYRLACARLNEIAERAKPLGITIGYHNHDFEFRPTENKIPMLLMLECLTTSVEMEWDFAWVYGAGYDGVRLTRSLPGRVKAAHIKAFKAGDEAALVGEDSIPWADVVKACTEAGGTEWFIIEHENFDKYPPLESVKRCHDNFRKYLA